MHTSVWIRPKARPRLGTRSPGRPPTPVRQHRPGPKWKGSPLPATSASSPPPRHRLMPSENWLSPRRQGQSSLAPRHSPLITSATRGVPVPSRLMTPKHLEGGAVGRTGWPENNQPGREEAPRPHPPKFKKTKLKGPRPSTGHSDTPRPPTTPPKRESQTQKFKTSQKAPNRAAKEWGAERSPSHPGCASTRLGPGWQASTAPRPTGPQFCTWSRGVQQSTAEADAGLIKGSGSESH